MEAAVLTYRMILSVAIVTKDGTPLVARQFNRLTRTQVEGHLGAFPKLLYKSNQSYIETENIRYVYQELGEIYFILITSKDSNILEDLDLLALLVDLTRETLDASEATITAESVLRGSLELVFAYDECIFDGYRQNVTINDVETFLKMESKDELEYLREKKAKEDKAKTEMNEKMQEGLVNAYLESGFLPEWASPGHRGCMVGNNSASVVADAYLKGIRGQDIEKLWEAVTHGANSVHPEVSSTGRLGWDYYNRLGYVPCNVGINESAARTLEYAYDDWCIYTLGKALGKSDEELEPYRQHAMNYRNLYSAEDHLMRGRNEDGTFQTPFSPLKWGGDFTEGNSLHYTWSVFHDPAGLMELMGGEENFCANLDEVFEIPPVFDNSYYGFTIHEIREMQVMNMGNYAHGNQPVQHMIYLYNWGGQPWKAQYHIRNVMDKLYTPEPDGYCGDEDNGQTSAWYVFSALGFYPVCPGTDQYIIGTPLFKDVTVSLANGKKIHISAPENSRENFYISGMTLNGKEYDKTWLSHQELMNGADIRFTMSSEPDTTRATRPEARPYSFSLDK